MDGWIILLLLALAFIFILPPVAFFKAIRAQREIESLKERLRRLEEGIATGGVESTSEKVNAAFRADVQKHVPPPPPEEESQIFSPPPVPLQLENPEPIAASSKPPPLPPFPESASHTPAPASRPPRSSFNWEQFMGAKMFAWIGGLALFLGVAFFVKYSFEHNLIPPEVRVAIGFIVGVALIVGGLALKRKENVITAQTLCATGILILYAVTFACRAFYHFSFFGLLPTFALMTLITAVAFLMAVRMNALGVAVLGIAGGFLTPVLLSTGQDNPLGLFGYVALLDIGLLLVARRKEWIALPLLGALGTVITQIMWVSAFFLRNQYFAGNNTLTPMAVFLAFDALFVIAAIGHKNSGKFDLASSSAALGIAGFAMLWAFYFFSFSSIGNRPTLLLSYLFLVDAGLLALVFAKDEFARLLTGVGSVVFLFLALWTTSYLTNHNLYVALTAYFIFAVAHSVAPLVLAQFGKKPPVWSAHVFPAITVGIMLLPICKLASASFLVWPLVFSIDLLALFAAIITGTFAAFAVVLLLTIIALGAWLLQIPAQLTGLDSSLFLIGGFAIFFLAGALWASRRLLPSITTTQGKLFGRFTEPANVAVQIPTLAASLPFLLLIMTALRLPLANPSPVFGLALLLIVLLLGLAKFYSIESLAGIALVCTLLLEYTWHLAHFHPDRATAPLIWYLGFAAIFTGFPFLFHRQFANRSLIWASCALAAPLHFFLVYHLVRATHPNGMLGLLPAAFALPALFGLALILKRTPADSAAKTAQLALFGAAILFFITLIFPIQFDRQWITLGWALEGVALCWLFHRVPHPGLRLAGVALIAIAFARLAVNPAVLSYHARASAPIFNWYLCTYGIVALCAFVAAKLLTPPRDRILFPQAPPLLFVFGTILVFLLLNIEIADYFSAPGTTTLTFQFTGNFARDMSYSIAWAMFALGLLVIGIYRRTTAVRYAGLALLAVVILKLFFHDLSQLDQLYRIAAFIVVAVIAIIASFLYQRFLGPAADSQPAS